MVKKKVDQRIRTLIENGVQTNHRSLFIMVGDHGQNQIPNLHYILSKAKVARRPSVLWCYKKELSLSSHKKKRMKQLKRKKSLGLLDAARLEEDPFELFLSSTDIHYTFYHETDKILGNTFGMCILQDFEALTPNLLARTIETVTGGGVIVLLLQTLSSLKQLYTMAMDVHTRYRTSEQHDAVGRFNERFLLSLVGCQSCLVVDDQLNVLPISTVAQEITPIQRETIEGIRTPEDIQLDKLKKELSENPEKKTISSLVGLAKTLDQATVLQSVYGVLGGELANGKVSSLRTTVALTAARGRGKSAALGLSLAAAISNGFASIFVTAPNPENLKTLFEFLFKGLDVLGYVEHMDYDIVQSTHAEFNKAVVRVNVFKGQHRQTILYIHPQDAHLLSQAELVIIDEAAAIPLPLVKALSTGPHLVFMASTINGYEGTGRSLSLKLIQQLRSQAPGDGNKSAPVSTVGNRRLLKELTLNEPIRYGASDPIERWLNGLLCLDVTSIPLTIKKGHFPNPEQCDLFAVNRDTLFSYHKVSEAFLQRMMALYVASHYKNTPNDLQLMSDAPAHRLFVLLPPVDENSTNALPEILAVIQVAYEGSLTRETVMSSLSRGKRAGGDLIPWTMSQQFQDDEFASLSGARIVRVAVHPELQGLGYGSRAIKQLEQFYMGKLYLADPDAPEDPNVLDEDEIPRKFDSPTVGDNILKPRTNLPPLLVRLCDRKPILLDWLGVSFGLTDQLFIFWNRLGFRPVYVRQTTNDITGEHTAIVLKRLDAAERTLATWLDAFYGDFCKRFVSLLSYQFRKFSTSLGLDLINGGLNMPTTSLISIDYLQDVSVYDLKRLESYSNNMVDYHMVVDMLPILARHYFLGLASTKQLNLSPIQAAILLSMGLQHRTIEEVEKEIKLPVSQLLAMFIKCVRKFAKFYRELYEKQLEAKDKKVTISNSHNVTDETQASDLPFATPLTTSSPASLTPSTGKRKVEEANQWQATAQSLEEDLDEAGLEARALLREKQRELINSLDLKKYEIPEGDEEEWEKEVKKKSKNLGGAVLNIGFKRQPNNNEEDCKAAKSLAQRLYKSKDADKIKKAKKSKYARA